MGNLGIHDGLDITRTKSPLRRRGAPQAGLTVKAHCVRPSL